MAASDSGFNFSAEEIESANPADRPEQPASTESFTFLDQQDRRSDQLEQSDPSPAHPPAPSCLPLAPSQLTASTATVPGLFPRRSINFIIGEPRSGRLRLALSQLDCYAYQTYPSFLDFPLHSSPEQLGCVLCGRDKDQIWHRIREMDLTSLQLPGAFPIARWRPSEALDKGEVDFPLDRPYEQLWEATGRPPRLLLVESLQLLMAENKQNEQQAVAIFLDRLQQFANDRDCAILGIVGSPKMRRGEGYSCLAHRISGSVQWSEGVNTLIGIERVRLGRSAEAQAAALPYRRLSLSLPASSVPDIYVRFDDAGALRVAPRPETPDSELSAFALLDLRLDALEPGASLDSYHFQTWADAGEVSFRTIRRWLADKLEKGQLVKEGTTRGVRYRKPLPN